jgi:SAM-dependent methyltransferase
MRDGEEESVGPTATDVSSFALRLYREIESSPKRAARVDCPPMPASTHAERQRLLEAALSVVTSGLPEAAAREVRDRVQEHVAAIEDEYLLLGVNPARRDADPSWDEARAAAYEKTEHVGAVHVELGSFTAFPDSRVTELLVGDGLAEFLRVDFDRNYRPDLVADVTALPLASASTDRVASNSLFEHVSDPRRILEETFRVLRPGGVMVVVMPFVFRLHGYPHDYLRLTPQYFERVCREVGFAEIVVDHDASSGLFNVLHNSAKHAHADPGRSECHRIQALLESVTALLGALVPLDRWLADSARDWQHSVRVLANKPGTYEPSRRVSDRGRPTIQRISDLLVDPHTKAPLKYRWGQLVCEFTGLAYRVKDDMAIFTEPRQISLPIRRRVRRLADSARAAAGAVREQFEAFGEGRHDRG